MVPSMYGWHLLDFRITLVGLDVVLANLWYVSPVMVLLLD